MVLMRDCSAPRQRVVLGTALDVEGGHLCIGGFDTLGVGFLIQLTYDFEQIVW
jgi:hypothetical protein